MLYGIKAIKRDIDVGYEPTVNTLKNLGIIDLIYNEYNIAWESPSLITVLKYNVSLTLSVLSETLK